MTLIICLVILALLTLLALGSMSVINLETAMVRNNQMSLVAYNHSLSEINGQINIINEDKDSSILNDALNSGMLNPETGHPYRPLSGNEIVMQETHYGSLSVEQEVNIDYLGQGNPAGASESMMRALRYDIHSKSRLANTGGSSDQTQGIYIIAPR